MEIDWGRLRSFRTSKEEAFEELCCQLAEDEKPDDCISFVRKGTPDAGIECYWKLADGSEIGWQAKFHRDSLNDNQWDGIEKSFKTALNKHPALTKYIICLPRNLSDSRNNKTEQDRYDDKVKKWKQLAKDHGREVEIELWNESQLTKRLSQPQNRGVLWFWFGTPSFTNDWFKQHVRESTTNANAQDRYDKNLHLENSEIVYFDAVCRNSDFWRTVADSFQELGEEISVFKRTIDKFNQCSQFDALNECTRSLIQRMQTLLSPTDDLLTDQIANPIPLDEIQNDVKEYESSLSSFCLEVTAIFEKEDPPTNTSFNGKSEEQRNFEYRRWKLSQALQSFSYLLSSQSTKATNSFGVLVSGEAGQGKTHTFCNWSEKAVENATPVILLFGENFDSRNPWTQIIERVGLNCDVDQFIGGLVAAARCNRRPALILIDGINEGIGKRIWKSNLAGMLSRIIDSHWIRIGISVRSTYRDFILPQQGLEHLTDIQHRGFSGHGREAVAKYFSEYGIQPSRPPLTREFDNPLFLKLFCKGMKANQLETVPRGINGISAISEFFLEGVNRKLADQLGLDVKSKLVQKAVTELASEMATNATDRIDYERAKEIVGQLHSSDEFEHSLFRHLEHEAILTTVPRVSEDEEFDELIEDCRFTFQRFSDHFIASHLLHEQIDGIKRKKAIADDSPLGEMLTEYGGYSNGVLDAIAVQLPELAGIELFELTLPRVAGDASVIRSVLMSLPWRDPTAFTPQLFDYLESKIVASKYEDLREQFWSIILSLGTMPEHPLNASWLHSRLVEQGMPERDAWWSTFLHFQADYNSAANGLIEWAWFDSEQYEYSNEVCELAALLLGWMFTTPNRKIRDSATKAMVSLCRNRPTVLEQTFKKLKDVNDPYLTERLMAVACGCSLLTNDENTLSRIAEFTFQHVFNNGEVNPNVLFRDYARLSIERAVECGVFEVDLKKTRPPYGSSWPEIPSEEEVKNSVAAPIVEHITGWYGHFAKDVAHLDKFSSVRIGERPQSPTDLLEQFEDSLTDLQWDRFSKACDTRKDGDEAFKEALTKFGSSLGKGSKKRQLFEEKIREILENPTNPHPRIPRMDPQHAKRWLQKRVMELGWDAQLFYEFDDSIERNHDALAKEESIGRKYCWIALRELQARAADNFELDWATEDGSFVFDGPWRIIYGRNIDPTNILRKTPDRLEVRRSEAWWVPAFVSNWNEQLSDNEWSKLETDIPSANELLPVVDDSGTAWLVARALYDWTRPSPPGERSYDSIQRFITCSINSYLVKKGDVERWKHWFEEDRRRIRTLPTNQDWSKFFFGEFYWSPIYKAYELESTVGKIWTDEDEFDRRLPGKLLNTSFEYSWEASSDFSLDGYVRFYLPTKVIAEEMGLRADFPGKWSDAIGDIAAIDPAVVQDGPNALLFNRKILTKYLNDNGLCMFWTIEPERRLLGQSHDDYIGQIEANGLYWFEDGVLDGELTTTFIPKGHWTSPESSRKRKTR